MTKFGFVLSFSRFTKSWSDIVRCLTGKTCTGGRLPQWQNKGDLHVICSIMKDK